MPRQRTPRGILGKVPRFSKGKQIGFCETFGGQRTLVTEIMYRTRIACLKCEIAWNLNGSVSEKHTSCFERKGSSFNKFFRESDNMLFTPCSHFVKVCGFTALMHHPLVIRHVFFLREELASASKLTGNHVCISRGMKPKENSRLGKISSFPLPTTFRNTFDKVHLHISSSL